MPLHRFSGSDKLLDFRHEVGNRYRRTCIIGHSFPLFWYRIWPTDLPGKYWRVGHPLYLLSSTYISVASETAIITKLMAQIANNEITISWNNVTLHLFSSGIFSCFLPLLSREFLTFIGIGELSTNRLRNSNTLCRSWIMCNHFH